MEVRELGMQISGRTVCRQRKPPGKSPKAGVCRCVQGAEQKSVSMENKRAKCGGEGWRGHWGQIVHNHSNYCKDQAFFLNAAILS